jgi:hypothetical protein
MTEISEAYDRESAEGAGAAAWMVVTLLTTQLVKAGTLDAKDIIRGLDALEQSLLRTTAAYPGTARSLQHAARRLSLLRTSVADHTMARPATDGS